MAGIWERLGIEKFKTQHNIGVFPDYLNPAPLTDGIIDMERCKDCGGICCKSLGCHFHPRDFKKITFDSMMNFIKESGVISLDWFEGDPFKEEQDKPKDIPDYISKAKINRVYFPRIRNVDAPVLDVSVFGQCCILTDKGCPLLFSYRPYGGRCLVPGKSFEDKCDSHFDKRETAKEWFPYKDIMLQVANEFAAEVKNMHLDPLIAGLMAVDAEFNMYERDVKYILEREEDSLEESGEICQRLQTDIP